MKYDSMRKLARNAMLLEYIKVHPGLSQEEVGRAFNISGSRVSKILKKMERGKA